MAVASIPPIEFPRTYLKKRLPGTGGVTRNNGGFIWQVMRKGTKYRGPTMTTRAEADAGLEEAIAALDRGAVPAVAAPKGDDGLRPRTISPRELLRQLRQEEHIAYPEGVERPRTRSDCAAMPRPCPFVSCAHHLYLDVNPESGAVKMNFPHLEVWQMEETCSLHVADGGGATLEKTGEFLNLTRERIRQVEERGLIKMKRSEGTTLGVPPDRQEYARPRGPAPGCP